MADADGSGRLGRVLLGGFAVLLASGPCTLLLWTAASLVQWRDLSHVIGLRHDDSPMALVVIMVGGLLHSMAATFIIALVQERLRPRRLYSVFVGAAAGAIAGGAVTLGMTLPVALEASGIRIWMFVAAVLMGLLYWRLAIRPSRRKRLRMARDRAAIRAME